MIAPRLVPAIVACFLATGMAASPHVSLPAWVVTTGATAQWSGTDAHAVDFGQLAAGSALVLLSRSSDRSLVFNPVTQDIAYVSSPALEDGTPPYASAILLSLSGQDRVVHVAIAATLEQQTRGLMGRTLLGGNDGMLFVFDQDTTDAFWMKDTPLPLSIAFVQADGTVVAVQDMAAESDDLHTSPAPYRYALEVNQGYFAAIGFGSGAHLVVSLPPPAG